MSIISEMNDVGPTSPTSKLSSLFTQIKLGLLYFGIEIIFSLEVALTIPILLKLKVPEA